MIPIMRRGQRPYIGFESIQAYPWVAAIVEYDDVGSLIGSLDSTVLAVAETMIAARTPPESR